MTEDIRTIEEILTELFSGKDAALEKYAKIRFVYDEMNLWRRRGFPLDNINGQAVKYFSSRFLNDQKISSTSSNDIEKGFKQLTHAMNDGCRGRCTRLVKELNDALRSIGLKTVEDIDDFLNWLAYDRIERKDSEGRIIYEKPYNEPIFIRRDKENRQEFWKKLRSLLKKKEMMSMQDVARIILTERRKVKIPEGA